MTKPTYDELLLRIEELESALQKKEEAIAAAGIFAKEEELADSTQEVVNQLRFIKTLFDTIPNPIFYKNSRGIYLGCNQSFANLILGIPPEKIIGCSLDDLPELIPKKLAGIYYRQDQALMQNPGLQVYETQVKCADGQLRDFIFYKTTYPDHTGAVAGIIGLMLDITEKNSIQLRLKESEEKYRSMMESMTDAVYICSPDFRISYMNPKMIERVGFDATGRKCHQVLHNNELPCTWCTFNKVKQGEITEVEVHSPKDGHDFMVTNAPILHQDGSISKMTIYRDITQRIKMEKELLMAKKLEAAGIFAGGIAHDYNNLLFIILGNLLLLKGDVDKNSEVYKLLEDAENAGQKAASLTKRLLAFTHNEVLSLEKIDVEALLRDIAEHTKNSVNHTILLKPVSSALQVYADSGLLFIVIEHIIENAKDAMKGGGEILIEAYEETVYVHSELIQSKTIERPGKYTCIEITDTGSGIDEAILPQIFDPYFSTKQRGIRKGLGLGLSTSYSIIKKHCGAITVDSKEGRGTRVSIILPMDNPSSTAQVIHNQQKRVNTF